MAPSVVTMAHLEALVATLPAPPAMVTTAQIITAARALSIAYDPWRLVHRLLDAHLILEAGSTVNPAGIGRPLKLYRRLRT